MIRLYKICFQVSFDIIPSDRIGIRSAIVKAKLYCGFSSKYSIEVMINIRGCCVC